MRCLVIPRQFTPREIEPVRYLTRQRLAVLAPRLEPPYHCSPEQIPAQHIVIIRLEALRDCVRIVSVAGILSRKNLSCADSVFWAESGWAFRRTRIPPTDRFRHAHARIVRKIGWTCSDGRHPSGQRRTSIQHAAEHVSRVASWQSPIACQVRQRLRAETFLVRHRGAYLVD
jgi:hypothetical protein